MSIPREGMLATVRNRRGMVAAVEPYDSAHDGRIHLVTVEYTDHDGVPEDTILWEREYGASVVEPNALPNITSDAPMQGAEFDALVRAARWSALTPFVSPSDPTKRSELPIASPFHGAVQVDDFQLVPLLKALQMPRVSLLLADDVGLGKTVEAGLILAELLLRRRIRRVLIITPASLRGQWQEEMKDKFSLSFDLIDRQETHSVRKRLGMDANPWRTFPRIITSYHYLRQPDVLEEFLATCRPATDDAALKAQLPWDLLIVDEAHNLMPPNFGAESDLTRMLRVMSPYFEHKLFLTATPHNGHTRSFSGLLELLDPVRFTQTSEFGEDEKRRIEDVVVRRLKREINELDEEAGRPPRFARRDLVPVPLYFGREERALSEAAANFRSAVKRVIQGSRRTEQLAGSFAIEVLNKRLLSCPYTFAESWYRFKAGVAESEATDASEVLAAQRAVREDIDDDLEREGRVGHAAHTVGAWMHPFLNRLAEEVADVDAALAALGLQPMADAVSTPRLDERYDRLVALIQARLRDGSKWRSDERLIVFTEYKTTLDYLEKRLRKEFDDDGIAIRVLFGGMPSHEKDDIKSAFNDASDPIRLMIATDAASEGLNLQETARLLLHYEIPWNPSRLEQRNGRLDRHGQARDVLVHHFTSDDDADLNFVAHVVKKVHDIREDLGSVGELFDAAFQRRFQDQEEAGSVKASLDNDVLFARGAAEVPRQAPRNTGQAEEAQVQELRAAIDLTPASLRDTLETALGIGVGHPRLEGPDSRGRMKLARPIPPNWEVLVDDTLRLKSKGTVGALPNIVFDPKHFIDVASGRPVFRPSRDTVLLHLGHPVFRQALTTFARARYPGAPAELRASRWTVRRDSLPRGVDALVVVTLEEMAINELRETFHHWVRTIELPVIAGEVGEPLPYRHPTGAPVIEAVESDVATASDLWQDIRFEVQRRLSEIEGALTSVVTDLLANVGDASRAENQARFDSRIEEVRQALFKNSLKRLQSERDDILARKAQGNLFAQIAREDELRLRDLEEELARRNSHYEELLDTLRRERDRVIDRLLPARHSLRGAVRVFPVAVEIRLPEVPS